MGQPDPFVVLVEWTDSWSNPKSVWIDVADMDHSECICTSVGFVIKWDKLGMSLAISKHETTYGCVKFIPSGAIRSVRVLKKSARIKSPVLASKNGRPARAKD